MLPRSVWRPRPALDPMLRRVPYNESRFLVNNPSGDPMARSGNARSAERKHTPRTAAKLLSGNRKSSAAPLPEPNEPAVDPAQLFDP
jgi:hypothetical protein